MATLERTLKHGLVVNEGEPPLKSVVLKDLTAGEIIDCGVESEKVFMTESGPVVVSSPSLMGAYTMCHHIERIGDISGPISMGMFRKLHEDDLSVLEEGVGVLKAAKAAEDMQGRGRDDSGSGGA